MGAYSSFPKVKIGAENQLSRVSLSPITPLETRTSLTLSRKLLPESNSKKKLVSHPPTIGKRRKIIAYVIPSRTSSASNWQVVTFPKPRNWRVK
jgi:hypothetical protein